jgi:hypothetical protein
MLRWESRLDLLVSLAQKEVQKAFGKPSRLGKIELQKVGTKFQRYEQMEGKLFTKTLVTGIEGSLESGYHLSTNKGDIFAKKVVSSLPIEKTSQLLSVNQKNPSLNKPLHPLVNKLKPFIEDNKSKYGGVRIIEKFWN